MKLVLVSAAAIYNADGHILLAQRPEGKPMAGLWEFPGGKVDPGETPEEALIRELYEELGMVVLEENLKPVHFASYRYPDFHLLMPLFECRIWNGTLAPREGQAIQWVEPRALLEHSAPAADLPLFRVLAGSRDGQG